MAAFKMRRRRRLRLEPTKALLVSAVMVVVIACCDVVNGKEDPNVGGKQATSRLYGSYQCNINLTFSALIVIDTSGWVLVLHFCWNQTEPGLHTQGYVYAHHTDRRTI